MSLPLPKGTPINSHNVFLLEKGDILEVTKPVAHQGLVEGPVEYLQHDSAALGYVLTVKYVTPRPPGATAYEIQAHADRVVFHSRPEPVDEEDFKGKSVIQDWVFKISLRQQGVVLLALRGPDGSPKESQAKPILRSLRACVMNSARFGKPMELNEVFEGDSFMRMDLISNTTRWLHAMKDFFSEMDSYNIHFYQHLIHGAAVVGLHHPNQEIAARWWHFYERGCEKLHMKPETPQEFQHRLRDGRRLQEDE